MMKTEYLKVLFGHSTAAFGLHILEKRIKYKVKNHNFDLMHFENFLLANTVLAKGEFTQYPFFVRFRPFFYVFASS